ncbi:MAG: tetratricopeptide repeat protein [Crocosphaera sp.]|nr:tetratricopeptide repeat protein [Crocosphaera sp.]
MNQNVNQDHSGQGDNIAGNKIVNNYYSDSSTFTKITTTAVIDTTLPPVNKWQGRQEEINDLNTTINNDNIRLIGIIAAGGYGKTALAVKVTEQLTINLRVLWVNFNQPYPLAQFGRWLLEKLQQPYDEKWDEETLILQIIQGLIAEPCLLILNNLETVLTAEGNSIYHQFLSRWLSKGCNSKVLLTSREQPKFSNNLRDRCYWLSLKGLKEADAMRYVTEDYGLTGTEEELTQFVNQMGRHPLLMQLVCSLMVDEFGEGVCVTESKNLDLNLFDVEGDHRDTETCVREVVTASLKRLWQRLEDSLTQLSVLRDNFDLELAQGISAEVTEKELRYLSRLSLLQEFPPEPLKKKRRRFQFLPLISMVVQQQADVEVLQAAHHKALDYYLAHLPVPPWESLEDLTAYLEGFYHAGELGKWQLAYDILNEDRGGEGKDKSVDQFLNFQGFYRKRAELYDQLIVGSEKEQDCYRNSLNRLCTVYGMLASFDEAITYCQQHHDLSKEIGDQQGVAISLGNVGNCYYSLGQYEKAINYHQQCHDLSKKIGDQHRMAMALGNLGNCYHLLGQYEQAITYHQQFHDISKEMGNQQGVAIPLGNLGNCYYSLGQYEQAIAYYQKQNDISRKISYQQGVANSLGNLGICYQSLGQYEKAITYQQQSLEIKEEMGDQQGVAISLGNLGNCYSSLRQYEKAITYQQQSLEIKQDISDIQGIANSLGNLGCCYEELGQYEKAITYHQQYLDMSKEIGYQQGVTTSLHNMGATLIKLGNYSEAETKIRESLVIAQEINYKKLIAEGLLVLAEIAHKTDRPELALTHCQKALELSQQLGIPLVKDCEELLAEIHDTLQENH